MRCASAVFTDAQTSYTENGLVETLADGKGNKTTFEYDGYDRLKKTRYPAVSPPPYDSSTVNFEELTYDNGGRVTSRRLRDGNVIGFSYDRRDRLTIVDIPGGTADDITNVYDVMGRLTASGIPGQNQTFAWDMLGRLTSAVSPIGGVNKTVSYQWDLAGRMKRLTFPTEGGTSLFVAYDYLVTGEMTELHENATAPGASLLAKYAYDNLGRRVSLSRAGGSAMTTSYAYAMPNDVRLSQLKHDLVGSGDDLTLGFAWTPASQIASRAALENAYNWTSHYNEDLFATVNGLNQTTSFGGAIAYDNRGNLTGDGTSTYTYDAANR